MRVVINAFLVGVISLTSSFMFGYAVGVGMSVGFAKADELYLPSSPEKECEQ